MKKENKIITPKGFNVKIKYTKNSAYYRAGTKTDTHHNVTEIHYNFKSALPLKQVAFESDIHGTGCTIPIDEIEEFEAKVATKIAKSF